MYFTLFKSFKGWWENGFDCSKGFLFRNINKGVRKFLLENLKLQSVISLPIGTFLPYTNAQTFILYFTDAHKTNSQKEYWYFDVNNDGYFLIITGFFAIKF